MTADGESPGRDEATGPDDESATGAENGDGLAGSQDLFVWAASVVAGGAAYVVGYLATLLLLLVGGTTAAGGLPLSEQVGKAGVVFSATQGVDTVSDVPLTLVTPSGRTQFGSQFNFFELVDTLGAPTAVPTVVYLAVPVVAIAAVAFGRAWYVSQSEPASATVLTALGMALGYSAVAYLGSLVFSYPTLEVTVVEGQGFFGTVPLQFNATKSALTNEVAVFSVDGTGAILMAGVYAVVLSALAAVAAVAVRDRL